VKSSDFMNRQDAEGAEEGKDVGAKHPGDRLSVLLKTFSPDASPLPGEAITIFSPSNRTFLTIWKQEYASAGILS
jgi:hypothetical protein